MAKPNPVVVQVDFPEAPKFEGRPEVKVEFDAWYYSMREAIIRQFESFDERIQQLESKNL